MKTKNIGNISLIMLSAVFLSSCDSVGGLIGDIFEAGFWAAIILVVIVIVVIGALIKKFLG
ncbi:hypothetical protein PZB74_06370 [Porifericola rhodea]|uniref:hypothetical protein n=1 Tax=Porifericola rhodea TaxID=930972 RepID=UPI00266602B8|nr:hypothetical protein [Porifericola rhodea]WKN32967.1 hypothetical protein PZB74_06370 [Porifericola rhodea]